MQKNSKIKTDKFNLHSYKIFSFNKLYLKKLIKHMVLECRIIRKLKQSFLIQNST